MSKICVIKSDNYSYPDSPLFRPSIKYPEYRFEELSHSNQVYDSVRECFRLMGLDIEHFGDVKWNPLGEYIKPGDNVLIKPNMVMDINAIVENGTDCLYTHPSVVAAVIDYVIIALDGEGEIFIGDAPMQECKFDLLIKNSGYSDLIEYYQGKGIHIDIVDFRELTSTVKNGLREQIINNNAKGKIVHLDEDSEHFKSEHYNDFRITNYDPGELKKHHTFSKHEYYISDYVLNANVIINMPKPKSHRKAGATIAMKNFVGINVRKEYLPHHTFGSFEEGGDEYMEKDIIHRFVSQVEDKRNLAVGTHRMKKAQAYRVLSKIIRILHPFRDYSEGSWYGNHTISKTICDLNKIAMYADKNGEMNGNQQRKIFIVADMIVSGEKEGPVAPSPKNVGIIAMGDNQVSFDETIADLMGFDTKKLPFLVNAKEIRGKYPLCIGKPNIMSNLKELPNLHFEPSSGWRGHIEKGI